MSRLRSVLRLLPSSLIVLAAACGAHSPSPAIEPPAPPPGAPAASSAAPAAPDPAPPTLRLPEGARPLRIALDLTITPAAPGFSGVVDLDLVFTRPASFLWLDAERLEVTDARLTSAGEASGGEAGPLRVVPGGDEYVGFAFGRTVPPGPAHLRIAYKGSISRKEAVGLFGETVGDDAYAYTQFESEFARRAFPCFDEPGYKVPWQVTLHVPKALLAFSNTPIASEKTEGETKTVVFEETPPLPSYLVAWAVGPFDVVDAGKSKAGVPLRIIVPRGFADQAAYAAKNLPPILDTLVATIGVPYPYAKLDLLSVPHLSGAMENAGLITCMQGEMLARPGEETIRFRQNFWSTMAHEGGHQWFGDLVTMAWWDDIWLNEAFATWISYRVLDVAHPDWHSKDRLDERSDSMSGDTLASVRKIRQPIESRADIADAFDMITYGKGGNVLYMFESFLGRDAFGEGVRAYLGAHAHGNATASDFVAAIGEATGQDVAPAFATFLDAGGLPAVTIGLTCEKGRPPTVSLEQKRYVPPGARGAEAQLWHVPVCVRWGAGEATGRACTLLREAHGEIALGDAKRCPDWILGNAGAAGYYRAIYDGDLLSRLEKGWSKSPLPDRLGAIDDVEALFADGKLRARDALPLLATLAADPNPAMLGHAVQWAKSLDDTRLVPDELRPAFHRFVAKTFGARARALGFRPKAGEGDDTAELRPSLLLAVADAGDAPLLAEAVALARKWLAGDRKAVDPMMVDTVLTLACRTGDQKLFDEVHAALKREHDPRERSRLLRLLGAFRAPTLVDEALAIELSPELDPREWGSILSALRRDRINAPRAYDYLRDHFADVLAKFPDDDDKANVLRLARPVDCDAAHRAQVEKDFGDKAASVPGGAKAFARILERTDACMATRALQQPDVIAFLKKY